MVIRHRFSAPAVLAFGAFLAGAIGIASALTPEFADRSRLVRGVLPMRRVCSPLRSGFC